MACFKKVYRRRSICEKKTSYSRFRYLTTQWRNQNWNTFRKKDWKIFLLIIEQRLLTDQQNIHFYRAFRILCHFRNQSGSYWFWLILVCWFAIMIRWHWYNQQDSLCKRKLFYSFYNAQVGISFISHTYLCLWFHVETDE